MQKRLKRIFRMQNGEASTRSQPRPPGHPAARGSRAHDPSRRSLRPRSGAAWVGTAGLLGRPVEKGGLKAGAGCDGSYPASFLRVFSVPVGCYRPVTKVSESYIIKTLTERKELEEVRAGKFLFTFSVRGNMLFCSTWTQSCWDCDREDWAVSETVKGDDSSCLNQNPPELAVKTKICPTMTR